MKYPECAICGKRSPRWSAVCNGLAAAFKIFVGTLTGSKGLVADGVHSIADTFASCFILLALWMSDKPHDEKHPYGYGKMEYVSTLFAATILFVCASLILVETIQAIFYGIHEVPKNAAIMATVIVLCYSYLMYLSNVCAGTQLGSPAIIADAFESKADSLSSAAVLVGLIGTKLGFIYADALAAAFVALLIYHMSIEMFHQGINGLIDSSADQEIVDKVVHICLTVEGVEAVRSIQSRRMGQKNWLDVIVDISEKKSILDTHMIREKVKEAITVKIKEVGGISVNCFPIKKSMFGNY